MTVGAVVTRIWAVLTREERRAAISLLILMLVGVAFEALGIAMVMPTIAVLSAPDPAAAFPAARWLVGLFAGPDGYAAALAGILILLAVFTAKAVVLALLAWRQSHFAFAVQLRLSRQLFAGYLTQPYAFHLQRNSAQLLRNAITSVDTFTEFGLM